VEEEFEYLSTFCVQFDTNLLSGTYNYRWCPTDDGESFIAFLDAPPCQPRRDPARGYLIALSTGSSKYGHNRRGSHHHDNFSAADNRVFQRGCNWYGERGDGKGRTRLSDMMDYGRRKFLNLLFANIIIGLIVLAGVVFLIPGCYICFQP
jgi:hypothetical protein